METIAPRNAEKHSELKPSSSRCEKKVAKIDRNLENFDILTALNAYICTATTRNRWVQVIKKRFETDLKVRCEANDERQEIRMKMVPRSVVQFAARLSSFKIISPWETMRPSVPFNNVKGFTKNAKNSDRQRFAFPSPSWIWRVPARKRTSLLVSLVLQILIRILEMTKKHNGLTTTSGSSIIAQFNDPA